MRRLTLILTVVVLVLASCSDDDAVTTIAATAVATTAPTTAASTTSTVAAPSTTSTAVAATTTTTSTTVPPTTTTSTTVAPTTTTTTTTAPVVTTTRPRVGNPPSGEITDPPTLTSHAASYDAGLGDFVAYVPLRATGTDPDGDALTYEWYSSDQGFLGSGPELTAALSTMGSDAAQPFITVVMTDANGNRTEKRIQLIVWIPSEE